MNLKIIFSYVFLTMLLGASSLLFADEKVVGEVINVSIEHKVVFADVGNNDIKVSEILKVAVDGGKSVYLEVTEASSVLTKLTVPTKIKVPRDNADFNLIKIGDKLLKLDENPAAAASPNSSSANLEDKPADNLLQDNIRLSNRVEKLNTENQSLKDKQTQMEKEMTDLKVKLDTINQGAVSLSSDGDIISQQETRELKAKMQVIKQKLERMKGLIQDKSYGK
jgi:hypothetical protein